MLFFLIVLGIVTIVYLVEVRLGSSRYVYNCELGRASEMREKSRLTSKEFFSRMLPLLCLVFGLPLLFLHQSLGLGLLALAGLAYAGSRLRRSAAPSEGISSPSGKIVS